MLLFLLSCVHHEASPPKPHAVDVMAARDALVNGDLPRYQAAMKTVARQFPLSAHPPEPQAELLAGLATEVTTLPDAWNNLGAIGVACGSCHTAVRAKLESVTTVSPGGDGVRAEMARHDRALALMWSGLIRPSDADLRAGADAFTASNLQPLAGAGAEATALDDIVTGLARDLVSGAASERAGRFGALIGTCAGCHTSPPSGLEEVD
jgi:hypothetical protein